LIQSFSFYNILSNSLRLNGGNSIRVYEVVGDRGLATSLKARSQPNANWSMVLIVFMVAWKCKSSLSRIEAYCVGSRYKINEHVSKGTVKALLRHKSIAS